MAQKLYVVLNSCIQLLERVSEQITAASYNKLTKGFRECQAPRRETRITLFSPKHEIGLKLILLIAGNEIISAWDREAATFRCAGSTCATSSGTGDNQEAKKKENAWTTGWKGSEGNSHPNTPFSPRTAPIHVSCVPKPLPRDGELNVTEAQSGIMRRISAFTIHSRLEKTKRSKAPASSSTDEIADNSKFPQQIPILSGSGSPSGEDLPRGAFP